MSQSSASEASSTSDLSLLAIGDVHLGIRPSSLPEVLDDYGVDPRSLTPEYALDSAIEYAISTRVDAVLFAGDVVESTNARFEALRPLESGVRRLLKADIPVLGVVGNHDVEALPRLVRMINGFELLGVGGSWQSRVIYKAGRPAAEILGWSFPEKHVRNSPVADLIRKPVAARVPGIPRIGLLHADLDASGGHYAPCTSSELSQAGLDAWLLGHIHTPSLSEGSRSGGDGPRGYLGSLVGLDPGEMGQHGPWLVRVTSAGDVVPQHLPIAPLRWDRFDLCVEPDEGPDDVGDRLLDESVQFAGSIQNQGAIPQVLGLRPRLVGPSRHYDALRDCIEAGSWNGTARRAGDTLVFIDKVLDGLDLACDLEDLARGDDPPALLARKLIALERPGKERSALLEAARSHLRGLAGEGRWSALKEARDAHDPLSDEALTTLLTRSGTAALSQLLSQVDRSARAGS